MAGTPEPDGILANADKGPLRAGEGGNEQWGAMLFKHREFLLEVIDSECGLTDNLLQDETLSYDEYENLTKILTSHERNKTLLDIICKQKHFSSFIKALSENQQAHIINYLTADGEYRQYFREEWPLSKSELSILTKNHKALLDIIDTSELIHQMFSNDVLSKRQREYIASKPTSFERSRALIEILRRGSLRHYRVTINCLRLSNQDHVAEILEKGGVTVRIDISVSGPQEDDVVMRMNNELQKYSPTERNEILRKLLDLNFIGAAESHSIALYFRCCDLSEIDRLQKLVENKQFTKIVEEVLVQLYGFSVKIGVKIKSKLLQKFHLTQNEFAKSRKVLKDLKLSKVSTGESVHFCLVTELSDLPLEVLDTILQKSYVYKSLRRHHREVIMHLALVSFCFFQRVIKRNFKVSSLRQFIDKHGEQLKLALFYRINRDYLKRFIQSKRLMSILNSTDGLSDVQIAILNRHKYREKKQTPKLFSEDVAVELIDMLRNSDEREQWSIIRCLRPVQRKHFERVCEEEGGLLKIDVKQTKTPKDRSPTSTVVDQMRSKLRDNGLDIFGALMDRDVVCWIWCQPQNIMKQFQQLDFKNRSAKYFTELLRILTDDDLFKLNVDHETLRKTMVRLSNFLTFASRLDIPSDAFEVIGITKLRNDIYVLCCNRPVYGCVIYVFEDRNQYQHNKEMKFEEIMFPCDIGSSEKENCLYITEQFYSRVWKVKEVINENRQEKANAIKCLKLEGNQLPGTLSVSRDGQLLMTYRYPPTIYIYGADAELLLSIQLPIGIYTPQYAIETCDGNFIILHRTWMRAGAYTDKYSDPWVLSEFNRDGKTIVHQFMPQDDEQMLFGPEYISICSRDRVIVADTGNNRVVLFDSDLNLIQATKGQSAQGSTNQIWSPTRLFYDDETKYLYVGGMSKEGKAAVNVYNFF